MTMIMNFIKRQKADFYLTAAAFILTIIGIILASVSSGVDGYALTQLGGILACTIIAIILMVIRVYLADTFGSQNLFTIVAGLIALVLLMVAFCNLISGRAVLASSQFTYDAVNKTGWTVLNESIAAIVMFLVSAILLAVGAFFKGSGATFRAQA